MNLKNKILIALNGNIGSGQIGPDLSFFMETIAVDGGARFFERYNTFPDILIGDLDSIDEKTLGSFIDEGVIIKRFPKEKDFSDFEAALDYVEEKYSSADVTIIGFFSNTRIDHFLFNLEILKKIQSDKVQVSIIDARFNAFVIGKGEHSLLVGKNITTSLLPLSEYVFIENTMGLEYQIQNKKIITGSSLTLSNITKTSRIKLKIREGQLLVLIPKEKTDFK